LENFKPVSTKNSEHFFRSKNDQISPSLGKILKKILICLLLDKSAKSIQNIKKNYYVIFSLNYTLEIINNFQLYVTNNQSKMDFSGKTVLITGGSRGIGKATAIAFAEKGARVAINFRSNTEAASETCELLEGEGHFAIKADVSKPNQVAKMIEAVVKEFGQLDILVNNAAIHDTHPVHGTDYKTWQRIWDETIQTNLIGAANTCFCAAQYMIKAGGGRIINVSSRGAFRGEPDQPAYGASKAGLNALSQSLAKSLAPHNIFIGIVAPGFTETDMVRELLESPAGESIRAQSPLNRIAKPEEVAYGILFLASEKAKFMTGAILDINGASYLRS